MDNPILREYIERLFKEPYRIREERQDGCPVEIPKPIMFDMERKTHHTINRIERVRRIEHVLANPILNRPYPVPFFCIDRYVIVDFKNGQLEAVKHLKPIPRYQKQTWMNLDYNERR
jgi:hypothetical protein